MVQHSVIFDSGIFLGSKIRIIPLGKKPTLWGGTYLYGLYMGVPPRGKAPIATKYLRAAFRKYRPTVGTSSKFDFAHIWLIDNR